MTSITFTVPGIPVAQPRQRHRAFAVAGRIVSHNYTPAKHPVQNYKAAIRLTAAQHVAQPMTGPVRIEITCYFGHPKSHYRSGKRCDELRPDAAEWHTARPDAENCVKAVLDAMTGVAYLDDRQVCWLEVGKVYDTVPRTKITIEPLEGKEPTHDN